MALTPLMLILHDRLVPQKAASLDGVEAAHDLAARVLMIGFGRMGQIISQPLLQRGHSISIIDTDAQSIRDAGEYGFKVWYGDGTRLDILHAAGAANASLVIVAIDNAEATTKIVEVIKHAFPLVPVVARAYDRQHALALVKAGVDFQMRETFESALAMAGAALDRLGDSPEEVAELIASIRSRDMDRFALECVGGVEAGISLLLGNKDQPAAGH